MIIIQGIVIKILDTDEINTDKRGLTWRYR